MHTHTSWVFLKPILCMFIAHDGARYVQLDLVQRMVSSEKCCHSTVCNAKGGKMMAMQQVLSGKLPKKS